MAGTRPIRSQLTRYARHSLSIGLSHLSVTLALQPLPPPQPRAGVEESVEVRVGDVIVSATDGVLDNLYTDSIGYRCRGLINDGSGALLQVRAATLPLNAA